MRFDIRIAFAGLALVLGSCQGGLDSGMGGMGGGMGGDMAPPVSQPGAFGASPGADMAGPTVGPNGQVELANPGATLAPNEAQYPVGQGPGGMKCPVVQLFGCTVAFNIPEPSPSPSGSPGTQAKPTPTPTAAPTAQASDASSDSDDDSSDSDDTPAASPTPPGTVTLQMEPLPKDMPAMTRPDIRFMHVTPVVAIRLQSDTDFRLNGTATAQYTLPRTQFSGRVFALQLYNETYLRGKRADQLLASYATWTSPQDSTVRFTFAVPKVTVRHNQIWLLALYGAQLPPGSTPTPSPTPAPSTSPSPSAMPSPSPTASP